MLCRSDIFYTWWNSLQNTTAQERFIKLGTNVQLSMKWLEFGVQGHCDPLWHLLAICLLVPFKEASDQHFFIGKKMMVFWADMEVNLREWLVEGSARGSYCSWTQFTIVFKYLEYYQPSVSYFLLECCQCVNAFFWLTFRGLEKNDVVFHMHQTGFRYFLFSMTAGHQIWSTR